MTKQMTLAELGLSFSEEQVFDAVVDRIYAAAMKTSVSDEDGESVQMPSTFSSSLQKAVLTKIDDGVRNVAAKHVLPNIEVFLETICLQQTNSWGEKVGKPVSFIEYLVAKSEAYIKEEVSHNGKTKDQEGYSWSKNTTRIEYLIHNHLQYSIEAMIKKSLVDLNQNIAGGLADAVKVHIQEALAKLRVATTIKP